MKDRAERIRSVRKPDEMRMLIDQAIKSGIQEIWIGGGDGSVKLAASQLCNTDVVLGILPLGTGNSLARELGIPIPLAEAVDALKNNAQTDAIDVGAFNGEVFVNVATLGMTSHIMDSVSQSPKGRFGRLVYLPAVWRALKLTRPIGVNITTSTGESYRGRALQFVAASSRLHGGPFAVTETASICDGKLSIYVVQHGDRAALWRYGFALVRGRHTELPEVWACDAESVKIVLNKRAKFVLDGDPVKAQFGEITTKMQALKVLRMPTNHPK